MKSWTFSPQKLNFQTPSVGAGGADGVSECQGNSAGSPGTDETGEWTFTFGACHLIESKINFQLVVVWHLVLAVGIVNKGKE